MSMIPNIDPKLFSSSAVIVGYLLIDDMTANEQNALGNWLMLIAQVLCTNAFYRQVQDDRKITSKYDKNPNSAFNMRNRMSNIGSTGVDGGVSDNEEFINNDEIVMLRKMVAALNKEIENLKNIGNKL